MNAIDPSSSGSIGKPEASLLQELNGTGLPTALTSGDTPELASLSKKFKSALKGERSEEASQEPASTVLPSPFQAPLSSQSKETGFPASTGPARSCTEQPNTSDTDLTATLSAGNKPASQQASDGMPQSFINKVHAESSEPAFHSSSVPASTTGTETPTPQPAAQIPVSNSLRSEGSPQVEAFASTQVVSDGASTDTARPARTGTTVAASLGGTAFSAVPANTASLGEAAKPSLTQGTVTPSAQGTEALKAPRLSNQTPEAPASTSTLATPVAAATQPSSLAQNAPVAAETTLPSPESFDLRQPTDRQAVARSDEQPDDTTLNTLGATVLQSFLSQSSTPATSLGSPAQTTGTTASAASIEKLQQVITDTVSRVLVSDPLHDGSREIRIDFAKDVLPDTSVRLWRDGGRLHVEFRSTASIADAGLKQGLPQLAESLQQRQPQSELPVVTLNVMNAGDQPGDGRSRQQYQTPYDTEDKA